MADNQPRDEHAKQLKQSISTVKQLRGWVASDPSRTEEFVDALNRATGLRLLSHLWQEAAPEATEAVGAANRLVTSRGPVGPYTPLVDAARYFTALVHVATVQLGLGLPQPAGQTVEAAFAWADQLTSSGLAGQVDPTTLVWALVVRARAALAAGDLAAANSWADAGLALARQSDLEDADTPVLLAALQADADARWAVRLDEESIQLLREAVEIWDEWTQADLEQLPRMAKPHLERVVQPVFALRRDLADRLAVTGRAEEGLAVRDELARLEHRTAGRRGDPGRVELVGARADQVWDLVEAGRAAEALRAAEDANTALNALLKTEKPVGSQLPTQLVLVPAVVRAELAAGRVDAARRTSDALAARLQAHRGIDTSDAARALALQVRAEVLDAQGDPSAAAVRAEADQLVAGVRQQLPEVFAGQDVTAVLRSAVRGVQLPGSAPTPYWQVPDVASLLEPHGAQAALDASISDEEAMARIDEQREQEARERAAAELREAAARSQREREQAEARAAALADVERKERLAAERAAAEQAEREAAEQEAREETERRAREQELAAQEQAAREAAELEAADQQAREQEQREAADRAEQERLAQERAGEAQREAAAKAEQERLAQEQAERERQAHEDAARAAAEEQAREQAERERLAAEQQAEAERAAQELARQQAEQERAAAPSETARPVEPSESDPLVGLRTAAAQAVASGDKQGIIRTHEALASALEPVAAQDPQALGRELVDTLDRLSDAQGWLRGRSAGRRAKQLAKEFGLA